MPWDGNYDELLDQVKDLPSGDYAECGVYRGASAMKIFERMGPRASLHLFDSFEGHPKPGPEDNSEAHFEGRYSDTSVSIVRELLPSKNVHIYSGFIPSRFDDVKDLKFRFVNIDTDHYASTRDSIEFFLPRMVRGGIIRFDDWLVPDCPGAEKAIREAGFSSMSVTI